MVYLSTYFIPIRISLRKRIESCDILSGYQQMDIMGSLISYHGLKVHHMSHDRVFAGDSHTTMNLDVYKRQALRSLS